MTKDLIIKNIGLLKVIQQLITVLNKNRGFYWKIILHFIWY
jgi:hypothetical protein